MITKHTLDSQLTLELPAREMMAWWSFNNWAIFAYQSNANTQISGNGNFNFQNNSISVGNGN